MYYIRTFHFWLFYLDGINCNHEYLKLVYFIHSKCTLLIIYIDCFHFCVIFPTKTVLIYIFFFIPQNVQAELCNNNTIYNLANFSNKIKNEHMIPLGYY